MPRKGHAPRTVDGSLNVSVLLDCRATSVHNICGWCHDNGHEWRRGRRTEVIVAQEQGSRPLGSSARTRCTEKKTAMHDTHVIPFVITAFVGEHDDWRAEAQRIARDLLREQGIENADMAADGVRGVRFRWEPFRSTSSYPQ